MQIVKRHSEFYYPPSSGTDGERSIDSANELSSREAAAQIASGRLTSEALVRACLDRIEAILDGSAKPPRRWEARQCPMRP